MVEVPIRQWVLTLPYPLRYRCAWNARLTSEVLQSFLRAVFADQRRRARKQLEIPRAQCGSVTFIQRFGSALNLTPHFHTLVLDGVYAGASSDPGPVSLDSRVRLPAFVAPPGPPPRRTAWSDLLQRIFEVDALRCPGCGGRMRVLSAITDANVAGAILRCLALPARAPPLAAPDDGARGSVLVADELFSETPAFDFDQSVEEGGAESSF